MRPSALTAALTITNGRRRSWADRKPAFSRRAAAPSSPTSTATPAARSTSTPRPATRGNGSSVATTTRVTPASRMRCVHGPVRPTWQHGSSVTYIVAAGGAAGGLGQRVHLGVRPAGALVLALPDHDPVAIDHHRADHRVGRGHARRRGAAWKSARRINARSLTTTALNKALT